MHVHCGANTHNCSRAKNRTSQYFVLNQSNVAFGRGHNRRSEHISDLKCIVPHSAARLIIKSECHPSPGIHLSMRDFGPSPPRLRWSRAGSQGGGRRRPRTERRASATGSRQPATGDRRQAAAHPSGVQWGARERVTSVPAGSSPRHGVRSRQSAPILRYLTIAFTSLVTPSWTFSRDSVAGHWAHQ